MLQGFRTYSQTGIVLQVAATPEFRVATSGLTAQNGMHAAASVNAITKSGTNTLHGNAFEFVRDRRFNAKSPFAAIGPDGTRQDDGLLRNQFGGTLGGPIARDRLFFFGGYQGTALRFRPAERLSVQIAPERADPPRTAPRAFSACCKSIVVHSNPHAARPRG